MGRGRCNSVAVIARGRCFGADESARLLAWTTENNLTPEAGELVPVDPSAAGVLTFLMPAAPDDGDTIGYKENTGSAQRWIVSGNGNTVERPPPFPTTAATASIRGRWRCVVYKYEEATTTWWVIGDTA